MQIVLYEKSASTVHGAARHVSVLRSCFDVDSQRAMIAAVLGLEHTKYQTESTRLHVPVHPLFSGAV